VNMLNVYFSSVFCTLSGRSVLVFAHGCGEGVPVAGLACASAVVRKNGFAGAYGLLPCCTQTPVAAAYGGDTFGRKRLGCACIRCVYRAWRSALLSPARVARKAASFCSAMRTFILSAARQNCSPPLWPNGVKMSGGGAARFCKRRCYVTLRFVLFKHRLLRRWRLLLVAIVLLLVL